MTSTVWHLRTAQRAGLALIGMIGITGSVAAQQPTLNSSGLTPQQCYQRDSGCTQFCGEVSGDMRYECFLICDRMLDNCLETGDWDDSPSEMDPGPGNLPDKRCELSSLFLRMLMVVGDSNGDGRLLPKEIELLKERVFEKEDANGGKQTPPTRNQP